MYVFIIYVTKIIYIYKEITHSINMTAFKILFNIFSLFYCSIVYIRSQNTSSMMNTNTMTMTNKMTNTMMNTNTNTNTMINTNTPTTPTNACTSTIALSLDDCLGSSSSGNTCCFNKSNDVTKSNICSEVPSSAASLVNGTLITNTAGNFTQVCLSDSAAVNTIPSTCGKAEANSITQCAPYTSNRKLYLCCFSQVTVAGRSKSACLPTQNKPNNIQTYKSGGVNFTCRSKRIKMLIFNKSIIGIALISLVFLIL